MCVLFTHFRDQVEFGIPPLINYMENNSNFNYGDNCTTQNAPQPVSSDQTPAKNSAASKFSFKPFDNKRSGLAPSSTPHQMQHESDRQGMNDRIGMIDSVMGTSAVNTEVL